MLVHPKPVAATITIRRNAVEYFCGYPCGPEEDSGLDSFAIGKDNGIVYIVAPEIPSEPA
jgi:hypothetical protein